MQPSAMWFFWVGLRSGCAIPTCCLGQHPPWHFLKVCFVPQPWFNYGCFGDFTLHFNCQFSFQKQWQQGYRHIWGRVDGVSASASIWCRGALLGCGRRQYMSLVISPIPSLGNCWVRLARSQNVWVCGLKVWPRTLGSWKQESICEDKNQLLVSQNLLNET